MTRAVEDQAATARRGLGDISQRLAALCDLSVNELRESFFEAYGFPTRSRNRQYLVKRVAWKIQADADGGLSQRALDRIEALAPLAPVRWRPSLKEVQIRADEQGQHVEVEARSVLAASRRDPRLPRPGTIIVREYRGRECQVLVQKDGFEFQGRPYSTLSKIAREVTGTNWNGFLFFKECLAAGKREKA